MFDSYYGGYRTRTFGQIFNSAESFKEAYDTCGIEKLVSDKSINNLFYLLYARYGTSHIANAIDENQFVYSVFSTVFMYGPAWEKRLEIQAELRKLKFDDSDEGIFRGGKAVYNHSYNPSTGPINDSLEQLPTINDQNTTIYKKSKIDGYSDLYEMISTDVTEEFIGKFKKLFITITEPDYPLLYSTPTEEQYL